MRYMVSPRFEKMRMELRRGSLIMAALSALQTEAYGYSLRTRFAKVGLEVDEGTLYPLIRRLESQGLLTSRWGKSEEGRKRRYYLISDAGQELLAELREEWRNLSDSIDQLTDPKDS